MKLDKFRPYLGRHSILLVDLVGCPGLFWHEKTSRVWTGGCARRTVLSALTNNHHQELHAHSVPQIWRNCQSVRRVVSRVRGRGGASRTYPPPGRTGCTAA